MWCTFDERKNISRNSSEHLCWKYCAKIWGKGNSQLSVNHTLHDPPIVLHPEWTSWIMVILFWIMNIKWNELFCLCCVKKSVSWSFVRIPGFASCRWGHPNDFVEGICIMQFCTSQNPLMLRNDHEAASVWSWRFGNQWEERQERGFKIGGSWWWLCLLCISQLSWSYAASRSMILSPPVQHSQPQEWEGDIFLYDHPASLYWCCCSECITSRILLYSLLLNHISTSHLLYYNSISSQSLSSSTHHFTFLFTSFDTWSTIRFYMRRSTRVNNCC